MDLYAPQIEKFKGMASNLIATKEAFKNSYMIEVQSYQTMLKQQIYAQEMADKVMKDKARQFK